MKYRLIINKMRNWIIAKYYIFLKILEKPIFNSFLNLAMLLVAIYAIVIAQKTLKNANDQFEINSTQSDSLFNTQLRNAKELNDNLIAQIKELQQNTNKQVEITGQQLSISTKSLNEYVYSGRPKILFVDPIMADTILDNKEIFKPKIVTRFKNVGQRFALHFNIRPFLVYNNYSSGNYGDMENQENVFIEADKMFEYNYLPTIPALFKTNFYYCFEITYYDDATKKEFNQAYYLCYSKNDNKYVFSFCKEAQKSRLNSAINQQLKKMGKKLFDK